mmetsp:Transcript_4365/g.6292  ORF Transcript_4365/g.6292 Transcript_4365/m.6292 type:complete len:916 (+) Transcript_4365:298-3045(+)|eukprot:CAMPEP_0194206150 /NCGR_PEP_ID=MMETSP0156-20130528/5252_1 /TAXON_ID=33649 /ORGANISM="Thalassionema nitzschioides, Strain L26-B" /LENGTH=915 /DNA_ID=CAMNT_0038932593 /DNA_START=283 /DNA_END=3030 /DNA_ORIENTATION=+
MEGSSSTDQGNDDNHSMNFMWMTPSMRRAILRFLNVPSAADSLPTFLSVIVTNGKLAVLGVLIAYCVFVSLWFPFWLLSFVVTEWGVYALFVGTVFLIGRMIVRLLAFPGSSSRVSSEVETEFSRYSIRMLTSSMNSVVELVTAINKLDNEKSNTTFYDVATAWKRVQQFRDRVISVYYDVLVSLYNEQALPGVIPPNSQANAILNHFGNNRLTGDIGNLSGVTLEAQEDGRRFLASLGRVLTEINSLETKASSLLSNSGRFVPKDVVNDTIQETSKDLLKAATELKDMLPTLAHDAISDSDDSDLEDIALNAVNQNGDDAGGGKGGMAMFDAAKAMVGAILPLLDPAPHKSIFGLDVLRGTNLARYRGSSQLWIPRPKGGRIDAFHIPSLTWDATKGRNRKAVLYCNPNAGLIEVATGMSLAAGNCSDSEESEDSCWTDFYTRNGYDVYLFNYAGYGRSHGTPEPVNKIRNNGCIATFSRVFNSIFLSFQPTPESIRSDALATGSYLVNELGIDSLVIHGESIGGMAAAGAARGLTNMPSTREKIALLVCDRTFCNLQAVAQRLVGNWTAPAISLLVPFWNTDVAADFLAATCPKIVAQDHSDNIIADPGSLKSGISLWKEIRREASTKSVGWAMKAPTEYLTADWENVGVLESKISPSTTANIQSPSWPTDKYISEKHAFHFAACARRIGKMATSELKENRSRSNSEDGEGYELDIEGSGNFQRITTTYTSTILDVWKSMSCCDGLCGATLGSAVKNGNDCTLTWLCCTLTFGGQVVAVKAEKRVSTVPETALEILSEDFDLRPIGYECEENEFQVHPKSLPEVIETLKNLKKIGDTSLRSIEHEFSFCMGMFEYIVDRLRSPQVAESSRQELKLHNSLGQFLNLECGHNNFFSHEERVKLISQLNKISSGRH